MFATLILKFPLLNVDISYFPIIQLCTRRLKTQYPPPPFSVGLCHFSEKTPKSDTRRELSFCTQLRELTHITNDKFRGLVSFCADSQGKKSRENILVGLKLEFPSFSLLYLLVTS